MSPFEIALHSVNNVKLIDPLIGYDDYVALDLSDANLELSKINCANAFDFENFIDNYLNKHKAKIAYGGYNEKRSLYKRSFIFNENESTERNIHIGLDIWAKAATPIFAAIHGTVHSFKNNLGLGNYGPTIILQHNFQNHNFYTLYGHLSLKSIENIEVGRVLKKGELLGTLGDYEINGDYAPHLHFQIIKDIGDYFGDYPGVCNQNDLSYYLSNCPDPNVLLKIKSH
jgi:murein DD-endopeptidase MepM/ murein hydrolase activator NlpD